MQFCLATIFSLSVVWTYRCLHDFLGFQVKRILSVGYLCRGMCSFNRCSERFCPGFLFHVCSFSFIFFIRVLFSYSSVNIILISSIPSSLPLCISNVPCFLRNQFKIPLHWRLQTDQLHQSFRPSSFSPPLPILRPQTTILPTIPPPPATTDLHM